MQPGSTYAVNGHLTVLDDKTTYALTFDPDDAVVPGAFPAQGHTIAIDYTFAPTQFTAHFASQLTLGHKIRLSASAPRSAFTVATKHKCPSLRLGV
ncbi:hypothetical protein PCANC_22121 [Puccinia coronata f. sp. avenae]|uniref:Uncharacterized protein n=1 Tax=Puccinia coronata f. sp. avenae TaxID=200324 RepID=A0A2N5SHF2_9BASI|nr:hypothetical protein PCANC_22121 [Puccinia coronata f. sp. avenae]PLW43536.1 hypothetical protein PCASD_06784 [Puccinia coronata f. sp. avenae]